MLSIFLKNRIEKAKEIIDILADDFEYVSIFGRHAKAKRIIVNSKMTSVGESNNLMENEAGFVIKVYHNKHYSEYSLDDLNDFDLNEFKKMLNLNSDIACLDVKVLNDEPLVKSFSRCDNSIKSDKELLNVLNSFKDYFEAYDNKVINVTVGFIKREVSSIFVSKNKCMDQYYTWNNLMASVDVRSEDNLKYNYRSSNGVNTDEVIKDFDYKKEDFMKITLKLLEATSIKPGIYDVVTNPSISGLIAHEAFGHGVEMDMFVKNRAKAKDYVGKKVASDIVNMHDGASATLSAASYFFDDDGILAKDTTIIENGILVNGISDVLTACVLDKEPSGNSRRESTRRKAYSRMTNTFFLPGSDKKEDIFKSIKYGYYLCDTNNGMEDPKNWNIQCTAQYALEIKDGEFTGKIVSPVVISGSVLDVLNSISMISDEYEVIGSGMCGKGHKEWVHVSDGGPYMKARVKLG